MASQPRCPICRNLVAPRSANSAFPFCSDRCRLVDLGKWLGEDYRVPVADEDNDRAVTDEEEESSNPAKQ